MGNNLEEKNKEMDESDPEYDNYKVIINEELKLYLNFIHDIKTILTTNPSYNIPSTKHFFLAPRFWFEDWERRVETLIEENKITNLSTKFLFKNENKPHKFFYELIPDNLWYQFIRNNLYKIDHNNRKEKRAVIGNNILIFPQKKEKIIEIFFFEKEDDIIFTNLFFEFGDNNVQYKEYLERLKTSPIEEIFGTIHYNINESEFNLPKLNITIYNKTRKISEKMKTFFKKQYENIFGINSTSSKNAKNRYFNNEKKIIVIDNYGGKKIN